jgi:NADH-quinone oxidoreductase subunit C/D
MWEGFNGYPLRKDWQEAYFEEDGKPFKSRWPDGNVYRIEDKLPYANNVAYPDGFDPSVWEAEKDSLLYESLKRSVHQRRTDVDTEIIMVNMGPHGLFAPQS